MCIGDFNDIRFNQEKERGQLKQTRMMDAFNNMIGVEILDARFKDQSFTWCNNRESKERVREN